MRGGAAAVTVLARRDSALVRSAEREAHGSSLSTGCPPARLTQSAYGRKKIYFLYTNVIC